jgi:rare lipoprotein A
MRSFLNSGFYLLASASLFFLASCASLGPGKTKDGVWTVSWYGDKFHGRQTSSGEIYDMDDHTAAHRALPFGTRLELFYPATGRSTVVRVNDRGPFIQGRDLDVSRVAAKELGMTQEGVAQIRVRVLGSPGFRPVAQAAPGNEVHPVSGNWIIQVGSFSDRQRAIAFAGSVPADCGPAFVGGAGPHRVYVGPFEEHNAVLAVEAQLKSRGYSTLVRETP